MFQKEATLKIEYFYNNEDVEFHVTSKRQMLSILQGIAVQGARVALFYGSGQSFIPTTLLACNEEGMWLDVGPYSPENKHILLSEKITFVSSYQHVKIQFEVKKIGSDVYENREAFYLELPAYLLRLQRREFFRTAIPLTTAVKCIFPIQPEVMGDPVVMRSEPIVDISGGGIGLLCGESESTFVPDKVFSSCQLLVPDVGVLSATIEVRNCINFTTPNEIRLKRIGCRFAEIDNQTTILLQRYITRLQSEMLVKE
jgi:c-di-GMP-binding flagellar brake protein YcgR